MKQKNEELKYDSIKKRGTDWKIDRRQSTEGERRREEKPKTTKIFSEKFSCKEQLKYHLVFLVWSLREGYTEINTGLKTKPSFYLQIVLIKYKVFISF